MKMDRLESKVFRLIEITRDLKTFGRKIIAELKDRGRTWQQIAPHVGCSAAHISLCACGKREMSPKTLLRLIELAKLDGIDSV